MVDCDEKPDCCSSNDALIKIVNIEYSYMYDKKQELLSKNFGHLLMTIIQMFLWKAVYITLYGC